MDSWGWSWISSRTAWRTQELQCTPGTGEKGHEKVMYVRLPKHLDERPQYETPAPREAAADTWGQKQLCRALQELAVLSEAGHETEARAQGARVRIRMLDGAVHPYEYKIQEKSKEQLSKELLQHHEQLSFLAKPWKTCITMLTKIVHSNKTDRIRQLVLWPQGMKYFQTTWSESTCPKPGWFLTNLSTLEWQEQDPDIWLFPRAKKNNGSQAASCCTQTQTSF